MAIIMDLGLLFYILLGFRYSEMGIYADYISSVPIKPPDRTDSLP